LNKKGGLANKASSDAVNQKIKELEEKIDKAETIEEMQDLEK
jgi:hypothetical protein